MDIIRDNILRKYTPIFELKKNELQARMTVILDWILGIEKSDIRQIFMYRYIDNLEWNAVAQKMSVREDGTYDDNITEDSMRKKHDRFLEKLK